MTRIEDLLKDIPAVPNPVPEVAVLRFRSRRFRVPRTGFRHSLPMGHHEREIGYLYAKLAAHEAASRSVETDPATAAVAERLRDQCIALFDLYHQCVKPLTVFDRIFWRWRANPFLDASDAELADLIAFFVARRSGPSRIQWVSSVNAPAYLRRTYPPTEPKLWLGIRPK